MGEHYRGATSDTPKGRAMIAAVESMQGPKHEGPCAWPGCRAPWAQVDHIVPRVLGGSDEPENLQGLCQPHNAAKGDGRPYMHTGPVPAPAAAGTTSREWLS